MALKIDSISYKAYRAFSLVLAGMFVLMAPLLIWLPFLRRSSDFVVGTIAAIYLLIELVLLMFHRNASCPNCGAQLGVKAPVNGICQSCRSPLNMVRV
jgi:hypothetical protein